MKSLSPPPARDEQDRTPDRSRYPVRTSRPTGQTNSVQCVWNMAARKLGRSWKGKIASWRGKPPRRLRSCAMPWTTASRSRHLRRFWDRRKRRVVSRMRRLVTSQSQILTSQTRVTIPAGCKRKWCNHRSLMARPGRRRGRMVTTTVPEMKIGAETNSRDRGSPRHRSERHHLPRRHTSDHHRPASTSGRSSDRGREWSSTSCRTTSASSRHHDPTGQQGSSRQSHAEDRVCGSTAQPAASSLSKRETSSRGDLSGHPVST